MTDADDTTVREQTIRAELDAARREVEQLRAALWLVAHEEAFCFAAGCHPFLVGPMALDPDSGFVLAINVGDTFAYATADCEPFGLDQAPHLVRLMCDGGWQALVRWVAEHRGESPLPVVEQRMDEYLDALGQARREVERLREENARRDAMDVAELAGIVARLDGASRESCPHADEDLAECWRAGWDDQEVTERLRAEVADTRARLAAETGGEVEGWKWAETRGEYYWTWQGCASEWCVRVFSNRAGWWWMTEGPGNIENTDVYMRQDVLDAMREAVAAYERLRGEEDGDDA